MSKRIAPPPRGKINVRSDFRVGEFEVAIENQGYRVAWEHASICPCRSNHHGGQPSFDCPVCSGSGYEYHSKQEIKAIIDKMRGDQQVLSPDGSFHKFHSADFTVLAQHRPSFYHRYTLLDSVMEHSELAKGTKGQQVILSHRIASGALSVVTEDSIGNTDTTESNFDVLRVRAMDATTRLPSRVLAPSIDYHIIDDVDSDERRLIVADEVFTELGSDELYFSVTYYIHPRFKVMDFVYSVRDTFVKFKKPRASYEAMPITVNARLDVDTHRGWSSGGVTQGDY